MYRHVLFIFPHPDDETLACGGTIIQMTRDGIPVSYICGTLGEMGRNMGKPTFATRETLPQIREQELREACDIMGVRELRLLGIRDKTVEFLDPEALADRLRAMIRELDPDLVITYHPVHGVHPDHNALGAAVVRALEGIPKERRPALHTRAFGKRLKELGDPDYVRDVRDVMEIKVLAMRAHRSQTQPMFAQLEAELKKHPEKREEFEKQRGEERYWIYRFTD